MACDRKQWRRESWRENIISGVNESARNGGGINQAAVMKAESGVMKKRRKQWRKRRVSM
jgi:hypothetical protein